MSDSPIKLTGPGADPGKAWWAPSMGRMTTKARIATVSIAAALLAITLVVWNLPTVTSIVTGQDTPAEITAREQELLAENQRLQDQLDVSRSQSDALRDVVKQEQAARKKGEDARAEAEANRQSEPEGSSSRRSSGGTRASGARTTAGTAPAPGSAEGAANPVAPQPADPAAPAPATKPSAPSKAALVNPSTRYYGMYTDQAPFNWATFDDAANEVGRSQNLVGYFGGWDQDFRANAVTRAWDRGLLPMLTWESRPITAGNDVIEEPDYTLPKIINGEFDAYLTQYARDIVATGLPLAIRLDHEMNGVWYPWAETTGSGAAINGNRPGDFVAMWRHVHDIFQAAGANQYVIWVWSPNIVNNLPTAKQGLDTLQGLYPGDAYVDWVGVSGYQRPPYKADNNATFEYTYDRTLDQLRQLTDKKILLAEVGASETGGTKPAWVRSFFSGFDPGRNDDVIGFAWFNLAVTTYVDGQLSTNDWRVDSRANSLAAFSTGIAHPARNFGGTPLRVSAAASSAAPATAPATESASPSGPHPSSSAPSSLAPSESAPSGSASSGSASSGSASSSSAPSPLATSGRALSGTATPTPSPSSTGTTP
ncbi:glycosyl hydrolase [Cellulomonas sp. NPDC089187]|uniref:glycoside hydrolase family 26 protein n=1 Tax=Cellulomonas sp. NPDC089187 TaxID=3154970 RepID=UPI00342CBCD2